MPKSKPDKVVVHRIEFNNKERELLEKVVESKQMANYAKGAKDALIPVGIVFIGGVAYLIADGIYDMYSKHKDAFDYANERNAFGPLSHLLKTFGIGREESEGGGGGF